MVVVDVRALAGCTVKRSFKPGARDKGAREGLRLSIPGTLDTSNNGQNM